MNADHILVVMHGEIAESGSHHDLISSKGKYHDLWSKQIFVKPASDRSRSHSPMKRESTIINDLTPTRHKIELAKVMKSTVHVESRQDDVDVSSADHKVNVDGKVQGNHNREVSYKQ